MSADVPLSIDRVILTVRDTDAVGDFYQRAVGLHRLGGDGESLRLGAGGKTLLELRRDAGARVRSPREAGLFHTAFLLPTRGDLGRWTEHAIAAGVPVAGVSDHGVSEAIYLADPEGNGVEIYADRPAAAWKRTGGGIEMQSAPLDVADLRASAGGGRWQGFPEGATVGHVHLQVGEIAAAEAFYADRLGLALTTRYPGASFFAADGYHHHLAANVWNSRGAGPRALPSTGLADVRIRLGAGRRAAVASRAGVADPGADALSLRDPWGTAITLVAA